MSVEERLAIDECGDDCFVSHADIDPHHVFGGLLIAQALRAAAMTVGTDRTAYSLHASFVASGTGGEPIRYRVERTRDGSSFATRRVVAEQTKGTLLVLTAGFHHDEPGPTYEPDAPLDVPLPEECPVGRYDSPLFESRDVPVAEGHVRRAWFRPIVPLPVDEDLHLQALAFISDFGPTRAAREPFAHLADEARRQSVSLDHSVWFHRPARVADWLLCELTPAATGQGRGLALGSIRTRAGELLATVAQEVLLRER
jgi:acyl-CoA thioesterase-2